MLWPGSALVGFASGGGGVGLPPVTSGLELALDAGFAESYPGTGQFWIDLSGGSPSNFVMGQTDTPAANDPTFNGTAGGQSSSEYFSFDGGDQFRYDAANETWMNDIHKDNATFSLIAFWRNAADPRNSLSGTRGTPGGDTGFSWEFDSNGSQQIFSRDAGTNALLTTADSQTTAAADHMHAMSINEAAGAGGSFFYLDGAYDQVSAANTFDGTYMTPAAGNSTEIMEIGARGSQDNRVQSGTRIYIFLAYSRSLSKAEMDQIWNHYRGRFGL